MVLILTESGVGKLRACSKLSTSSDCARAVCHPKVRVLTMNNRRFKVFTVYTCFKFIKLPNYMEVYLAGGGSCKNFCNSKEIAKTSANDCLGGAKGGWWWEKNLLQFCTLSLKKKNL